MLKSLIRHIHVDEVQNGQVHEVFQVEQRNLQLVNEHAQNLNSDKTIVHF